MAKLSTHAKRTSLGLVAMLASLMLLDLLPLPWSAFGSREKFFYFALWPELWTTFNVGVAALIGAYIAKTKFVIPAVTLILAISIVTMLIAQSISSIAEMIGFHELFSRNLFAIVFAIIGAVIGVAIGERLSGRGQQAGGHAA